MCSQIDMFSGIASAIKKTRKKSKTLVKKIQKIEGGKLAKKTENDYLKKKFSAGKKLWLSPSGVSGLDRCPRCFWLQYNRGIYHPEGIVSRLANRFDSVIKQYFDLYRPQDELPPMISGKIEGVLQNPFQEAYFFHYNQKYGYMGKLDECLVRRDGKYTPIDHKTSSSDPREKDILPAYQNQLDSYAFLLEANGKKTSGIGHLIYFYPEHSAKLHDGFKMLIYIKTLKTNPESAFKKFKEAIEILDKPLPPSSPECPFCKWHDQMGHEIER